MHPAIRCGPQVGFSIDGRTKGEPLAELTIHPLMTDLPPAFPTSKGADRGTLRQEDPRRRPGRRRDRAAAGGQPSVGARQRAAHASLR